MTSYWWIQFKAWNNTFWSCANKTWILTDFFFSSLHFSCVQRYRNNEGKKRMRMLLDMSLLNHSIKNENIVGSCQSESLSQRPILFLILVFLCRFNTVHQCWSGDYEKNSVKIHILLAHDQNVSINSFYLIYQ